MDKTVESAGLAVAPIRSGSTPNPQVARPTPGMSWEQEERND